MNQTTKGARTPAHDVQMTDLRRFLALTSAPLRSIHSHDGGIRSAAYGVRAANGLEALRLVAWFAIGPVDIGTTVPEEVDGRVVHALDVETLGFCGGALDDLALEILALHSATAQEVER